MAIKNKKGRYECFYCLKDYNRPEKADQCREEHDILYLPISRSDANRLLNYLFIGDPKILEGTKTARFLQKALRNRG